MECFLHFLRVILLKLTLFLLPLPCLFEHLRVQLLCFLLMLCQCSTFLIVFSLYLLDFLLKLAKQCLLHVRDQRCLLWRCLNLCLHLCELRIALSSHLLKLFLMGHLKSLDLALQLLSNMADFLPLDLKLSLSILKWCLHLHLHLFLCLLPCLVQLISVLYLHLLDLIFQKLDLLPHIAFVSLFFELLVVHLDFLDDPSWLFQFQSELRDQTFFRLELLLEVSWGLIFSQPDWVS